MLDSTFFRGNGDRETSMSGQDLSLIQKIRDHWSLFNVHRRGGFSIENPIKRLEWLVETYKQYTERDISSARVLEVGVGQRATITILMHSMGVKITGIDMEVPTCMINLPIFFKIVKINGWERALKSLVRHILFDYKFFSQLSAYLQRKGYILSLTGLDIRTMNARNIEFSDETFDFIYSLAVFEHIFAEDVEKAVSEIARTAKKECLIIINTATFGGLTAGHRMEWRSPQPNIKRRSPPWDHLRQNLFPVNTYLNGFRIKDFRRVFNKHLNVIAEVFSEKVGEQYLTPEILEELPDFSKEELLINNMTIIAKKKW